MACSRGNLKEGQSKIFEIIQMVFALRKALRLIRLMLPNINK